MDIVKLLQDAAKSILIALGLFAPIDVSFEPAVVTQSPTECSVAVRLRNALTPEIEEMIDHSTLVTITYSLTLFTERDTKLDRETVKSVQYKSITSSYTVGSDGRVFATTSKEEAVEEMAGASFIFDPSGMGFGVVKASLDIPDIPDKNAVRSLWGDKVPTIVIDLAVDR